MRRLAVWAYAFAAGIFLAQYLLPPDWLLACGAAALVLAWSALLLPRRWRNRVLLVGVGLSLAFGYDWLYLSARSSGPWRPWRRRRGVWS